MPQRKRVVDTLSSSNPLTYKTIIHERGLDFDPDDGEIEKFICDTIQEYKWEKFAESAGNFVLELVLEFYKNMNKDSLENIVKGTKIDFSTATINAIYNLDPIDDRVSQQFMNEPDLNLVEEKLCPFGANWGFDADGLRNSFRGVNISYKYRPFLAFISSRFTPNTNPSILHMNRISLLYCLCNKMPLDVGKLISENLKKCERSTIWFPSTITRLCSYFGVESDDRCCLSHKWIGQKYWTKIHVTDGPWKRRGEEEHFTKKVNKFVVGQFDMEGLNQPGSNFGVVLKHALTEMRSDLKKEIREQIVGALVELKREIHEMKCDLKKEMRGDILVALTELKQQVQGMEVRLLQRFDRSEHIQMQDLIYNCMMNGLSTNLLSMLCVHSGFHGEPSQYPYFDFMDPNTSPIPQYINVPHQEPQPSQGSTDASQVPMLPLMPQYSHHSDTFFDNLFAFTPMIDPNGDAEVSDGRN